MLTATRRGVRRSSAAGREKSARPTLKAVLAGLAQQKIPSKLNGTRTYSPHGKRIMVMVTHLHTHKVLTFMHPTKRPTEGRLCSVTI